ncbi:acyl-CoA reductase-like NAD-dependent aldehyde dehydrogenase [Pseudarthrobacter enclensis]|uniref:Acyl-CoA reductase-like NAD-dependent aldehyde dehydrogenase n=1 Tax=Pseudarthrobacter enclensis TaxID=993070 RepID=A0ABT9RTX8_9MICC|nr:acyl-CoA reductase-like NAD-dependent aldehyde dehydrogenase [Pseudarthrobacter enclensis]
MADAAQNVLRTSMELGGNASFIGIWNSAPGRTRANGPDHPALRSSLLRKS